MVHVKIVIGEKEMMIIGVMVMIIIIMKYIMIMEYILGKMGITR